MDAQDRRAVAMYGLVRSERDHLCQALTRVFCAGCGWECVEYHDDSDTRWLKDSAWGRMLADVAAGKYRAVVVWVEVEGLVAYCERYGTGVLVVDPLATASSSLGGYRKVRIRG